MKIRLNYIALIACNALLFSCKKDNYEAPKSELTGRLVYKGEAIQVEYDRVPFELYQYGFGKVGPLNSTITPEGAYSHVLFDGEYKFVIRPGQGPFFWSQTGGKADTVTIMVNGNTVKDIEVEPYHMIRTPQFSYAGGKVTANFKIEKIITDATRTRSIERATLYINKTQFVSGDGNQNLANASVAGSAITDPNNISLNVAVPTINPTQNYVFARIGLKTTGVEDLIFSPVIKLQF
ncbi:MAG: DUF3823 domain-containing protein [Chitinophagaceae bacterium]